MKKPASKPAVTSLSISLRYPLALGLIALLSISAYLSLYKVIRTQEASVSFIHVIWSQLELSQRAVLLAHRLSTSENRDEQAKWRKILGDTAGLMEKYHDGLTKGSEEMNLPFKLSPAIRAMYFDPPINLDSQVHNYLARIRSFLRAEDSQLSKNNPDLKYILSVVPNKLLPSLDALVHQYETESDAAISDLHSIEKFVLGLTLLVLMMEAMFIFRPAVRQIKEYASRLLASEKQVTEILQTVLDTVGEGIITVDDKEMIARVNDEALDIWGYSRAELIGSNLNKLIPSISSKTHNFGGRTEINGIKKDGSEFPLEIKIKKTETTDGVLFTAAVHDITERKRTEAELTRLGTAIEQAKESIIITDNDGAIQFVNPAFEKITGYSREEAIGQNPRILKSDKQDEAFYKDLWDTITNGKTWTGHLINKKKNGDLYEEDATIAPVLSPAGEIINYIAVKRDVTKEANLKRQARQSQKMESIGTLAGGIAHDFNNLLTPIIGYIEMVLDDMPQGSEKRENLTEALDASLRAKELVKQILTFSVKKEQELAPTSIHAILKQSIKLMRSSLPATIEILDDIDKNSGVIMADPVQIGQLVMNMCANAGYAMKEKGGRLSIILIPVEVDEEWAESQLELSAGSYVLFSVTDTGIGMSKETMDRIFDPFFTTKPEGEGTGVGLATVHGIVKAHNGVITVESQPGEGTTFNIFFPRIESLALKKDEQDFSIPKGNERILLVDDEEVLAKMGKKLLERLGYQVQAVSRSSIALEMFLDSPDEFDLLLTDQTMPGMDGSTLAAEIKKIKPNLPVIICTGLDRSVSPESAGEIGIQEFITKPYTTQSLAEAVRRALDCKIAKTV